MRVLQSDLQLSAEIGLWATQAHNEFVLDQAYRTSEDVYLIFGANKAGEFHGYARFAFLFNMRPSPTAFLQWVLTINIVLEWKVLFLNLPRRSSAFRRAITHLVNLLCPRSKYICANGTWQTVPSPRPSLLTTQLQRKNQNRVLTRSRLPQSSRHLRFALI